MGTLWDSGPKAYVSYDIFVTMITLIALSAAGFVIWLGLQKAPWSVPPRRGRYRDVPTQKLVEAQLRLEKCNRPLLVDPSASSPAS